MFLKLELFAKRLGKLRDMFTSIDQICALEAHTHIAGIDAVLRALRPVVDDVKCRPYDLLDFSRNAFDRDFLEFNVNVHELDSQMQAFVDASFEGVASTEHALQLLAQFSSALRRDALQQQLEAKWPVIFQHYARDLEAVQAAYEEHKHRPPLPRNAPPIAGNIMWARQLLQRIEAPMQLFARNRALMAAKESRRVVRLYNRVARALVEFEALWHAAWLRGVDAQRAGLSAPLLVRRPDGGALIVNLDRDVMALIREGRHLSQMGAAVPEAVRALLLQEDKLRHYFSRLSAAARDHAALLARVPPVFKPLLRPHLEELERMVAPGLGALTWTSLNVDGYLHRLQGGLSRLEELVARVSDVVEHRIEANLEAIRGALLVDLPADRSFTFEEFNAAQQRHQRRAAERLAVRNEEVARSVEDVIALARPRHRLAKGGQQQQQQQEEVEQEQKQEEQERQEVAMFRAYYSDATYRAILAAVQRSFSAIKRRVGSSTATGIFFLERPFFDASVELRVPAVAVTPTLEAIQGAVDAAAMAILEATKQLRCWGAQQGGGAAAAASSAASASSSASTTTYHELIVRDKEVVKSVLLLTGCVEGVKSRVAEFLSGFDRYSFLWTQDLQAAYDAFVRTKPGLEAFQAELKKYNALEQDVSAIPSLHNIGSLSLETAPLKSSLKSLAAGWKAQFAQNLHRQCAEDLRAFDT